MGKDVQPQFSKQTTFEVFRYQLVVDKTLPINLFQKYETADQVRADKNNIFQQVVAKEDFNFKGSNSELTSKFLYSDGTMSYFRLDCYGKNK